MKTFLIGQLRGLFSGGASYVILALTAAFWFQNWQFSQSRDKQAALEIARDDALALAAEKDTLIASQSRQYRRQINTQKDQEHAEARIQSVPDSDSCAGSAPIGSALDWLREHESAAAKTIDD